MIKLNSILKIAKYNIMRHSPEVLTGIGLAGMTVTVVLAVKATPKALKLIEDKKKSINDNLYNEAAESNIEDFIPITKLGAKETVKVSWKCYVPTLLMGTLSSFCIIGANSIHNKRHAALAAVCALAETSYKEYKDKVIETIGEKEELKIRDAVAADKLAKNPVDSKEVEPTGGGKTLCFDPYSGRYFKSDIETLKKAVISLNRLMLDNMSVSLNDLYYEIGLSNTRVGNEIGWNLEGDMINECYSSQLTDDNVPCLVLDFYNPPTYGFDDYCKF